MTKEGVIRRYETFEEKETTSPLNPFQMPTVTPIETPSSPLSPSSPSLPLSFDIYHELKELSHIAIPTVAVQLCTYIIFPITASYVGRNQAPVDMAAFSLASLSGNMTCISIIIGTLSASETLQPRAFALKKYKSVGIIAIRGFIICIMALFLPILLLLSPYMKAIFASLGQDPSVSKLSISWIHIYLCSSVPCTLFFRVLQRFLACQNIVLPCVVGSCIASFFIHPWMVRFWIDRYDFLGSAVAIGVTQFIQMVLTFWYVYYTRSYVKETWNVVGFLKENTKQYLPLSPSPSNNATTNGTTLWNMCKEAIFNVGELKSYVRLSLGGIFSLSEWWYWECLCFTAGHLGVVPLCIHSVIYQIIPLIYMIPLGFSIGLSVRIGQLLPINVYKAKMVAIYTMILVIMMSLFVTGFMYYYQELIVSLFTNDDFVKEGCDRVWVEVCSYIVGLYIFCLNSGILRALGLQWRMGMIIIVVLWFFSVPCIVYFCIFRGNGDDDVDTSEEEKGVEGLVTLWRILFWSYIILDIGLMIGYTTADWHEIGKKASLSITSQKSIRTNATKNMTTWDKAVSLQENELNYDGDNNDDTEEAIISLTEESSLISFESKSIMSNNPYGTEEFDVDSEMEVDGGKTKL